ncbi:rifin [Plasmodium reichenowi]|uniref:Rifin n=1 Tax=Plasmodium reichenowi TaxID=5854 RepID=A0A060RQ46_PLARE|nr:rifin [Plasmodium reichenowi]
MKVHYMNALLFALPLNILEHNQSNHKITTPHIPKIPTNRLLCECDLYMPNYDNDLEMKKVMENFNKQTQQRFEKYDDRMKTTRQKYKDKCDKEIQKIILKDKLEKELMDKFATLQTDIQNDAIPTCICEKSIAENVEKGCLRCGCGLGSVAPTVGLIGSVAVNVWKTAELAAATELAKQAGAAAGKIAGDIHGMKIVTESLKELGVNALIPDISKKISTISHYTEVITLDEYIFTKKSAACVLGPTNVDNPMCLKVDISFGFRDIYRNPRGAPNSSTVKKVLNALVKEATQGANAKETEVTAAETAAAIERGTEAIDAASYNLYSAIGYSVLAIIIIILIMVIIYKILRYRRKKKMKKKLQYVKLLEE